MQGCQSTNVTVCWYFPLGQESSCLCLSRETQTWSLLLLWLVKCKNTGLTINWVRVLSQDSPSNPMSVTHRFPGYHQTLVCKTNISQRKVSVPRPSVAMAVLCRLVVSCTEPLLTWECWHWPRSWPLIGHSAPSWLLIGCHWPLLVTWALGPWECCYCDQMSGLGCQSSTNK